jgi:hypothetical protein
VCVTVTVWVKCEDDLCMLGGSDFLGWLWLNAAEL